MLHSEDIFHVNEENEKLPPTIVHVVKKAGRICLKNAIFEKWNGRK